MANCHIYCSVYDPIFTFWETIWPATTTTTMNEGFSHNLFDVFFGQIVNNWESEWLELPSAPIMASCSRISTSGKVITKVDIEMSESATLWLLKRYSWKWSWRIRINTAIDSGSRLGQMFDFRKSFLFRLSCSSARREIPFSVRTRCRLVPIHD